MLGIPAICKLCSSKESPTVPISDFLKRINTFLTLKVEEIKGVNEAFRICHMCILDVALLEELINKYKTFSSIPLGDKCYLCLNEETSFRVVEELCNPIRIIEKSLAIKSILPSECDIWKSRKKDLKKRKICHECYFLIDTANELYRRAKEINIDLQNLLLHTKGFECKKVGDGKKNYIDEEETDTDYNGGNSSTDIYEGDNYLAEAVFIKKEVKPKKESNIGNFTESEGDEINQHSIIIRIKEESPEEEIIPILNKMGQENNSINCEETDSVETDGSDTTQSDVNLESRAEFSNVSIPKRKSLETENKSNTSFNCEETDSVEETDGNNRTQSEVNLESIVEFDHGDESIQSKKHLEMGNMSNTSVNCEETDSVDTDGNDTTQSGINLESILEFDDDVSEQRSLETRDKLACYEDSNTKKHSKAIAPLKSNSKNARLVKKSKGLLKREIMSKNLVKSVTSNSCFQKMETFEKTNVKVETVRKVICDKDEKLDNHNENSNNSGKKNVNQFLNERSITKRNSFCSWCSLPLPNFSYLCQSCKEKHRLGMVGMKLGRICRVLLTDMNSRSKILKYSTSYESKENKSDQTNTEMQDKYEISESTSSSSRVDNLCFTKNSVGQKVLKRTKCGLNSGDCSSDKVNNDTTRKKRKTLDSTRGSECASQNENDEIPSQEMSYMKCIKSDSSNNVNEPNSSLFSKENHEHTEPLLNDDVIVKEVVYNSESEAHVDHKGNSKKNNSSRNKHRVRNSSVPSSLNSDVDSSKLLKVKKQLVEPICDLKNSVIEKCSSSEISSGSHESLKQISLEQKKTKNNKHKKIKLQSSLSIMSNDQEKSNDSSTELHPLQDHVGNYKINQQNLGFNELLLNDIKLGSLSSWVVKLEKIAYDNFSVTELNSLSWVSDTTRSPSSSLVNSLDSVHESCSKSEIIIGIENLMKNQPEDEFGSQIDNHLTTVLNEDSCLKHFVQPNQSLDVEKDGCRNGSNNVQVNSCDSHNERSSNDESISFETEERVKNIVAEEIFIKQIENVKKAYNSFTIDEKDLGAISLSNVKEIEKKETMCSREDMEIEHNNEVSGSPDMRNVIL